MPQNFYSGNAVTGANGYVWIEHPDYFADVNTNIKYQLTLVGTSDSPDFIWARVVQKFASNRFKIKSNKPGVDVFWRVEGVRNDK